jgi:LPS O-antigen subunit length determinant protein (WzzB/FepE family)
MIEVSNSISVFPIYGSIYEISVVIYIKRDIECEIERNRKKAQNKMKWRIKVISNAIKYYNFLQSQKH